MSRPLRATHPYAVSDPVAMPHFVGLWHGAGFTLGTSATWDSRDLSDDSVSPPVTLKLTAGANNPNYTSSSATGKPTIGNLPSNRNAAGVSQQSGVSVVAMINVVAGAAEQNIFRWYNSVSGTHELELNLNASEQLFANLVTAEGTYSTLAIPATTGVHFVGMTLSRLNSFALHGTNGGTLTVFYDKLVESVLTGALVIGASTVNVDRLVVGGTAPTTRTFAGAIHAFALFAADISQDILPVKLWMEENYGSGYSNPVNF